MLRLACSLIAEDPDGIQLCCPIHDAVLVEAPIDEIDAAVADPSTHGGSKSGRAGRV